MLLFDEFGSLAGGRALAINIVERARSSGAGVLLSAQSAAGVGSEPERERLLAASSAVVLFRSPMPAGVAALAGSERTPEGAWSFPGGTDVPPDRVTVTERHRPGSTKTRFAPPGSGKRRSSPRAGSNGPGSSRRRSRQKRIRASKRSYHMDPPALWRPPVETPKHLTNDELQLLLGVLLLTISLGGLALLLVLFA
jgi:hypothetical protein